MNIYQMKNAASRASTLMKALSSETRLMLLCQIGPDEKSVNDLAKTLEMRPASVSQQLSLLRKDNLVTTRRDGQTIYYSLYGEEAKNIIATLYDLYCNEADSE
jgi:ArsR family transcriptional regulator, virulence genes transcriptional regulator